MFGLLRGRCKWGWYCQPRDDTTEMVPHGQVDKLYSDEDHSKQWPREDMILGNTATFMNRIPLASRVVPEPSWTYWKSGVLCPRTLSDFTTTTPQLWTTRKTKPTPLPLWAQPNT
jgi:hypothetical protein